MKIVHLYVFFIWVIGLVEGGFRCHKGCNGHGKCSNDDVCHCQAGWDTLIDCSQRRCPSGVAWADKAQSLDSAHGIAECSNNGLCDKLSGTCRCFTGFEGAACHRRTCEQNCNNNGICMTIGDIYRLYNTIGNETAVFSGWERNATTTCACDPGYTGGQCELRMCPKGDDPMTPRNGFFTLYIRTLRGQSGNFKFCFQGQCFSFPALPAEWSNAACKTSFQSLPNIRQVNCTSNATGHSIRLQNFPVNPYETNLWSHLGAPSLTDFGCDVSGVTGYNVECYVSSDTSVTQPSEYEYCSRRGKCDMSVGQCTCYPGFYGPACSYYQPAAIALTPPDILTLTAKNPAFSANVLHFANTIQGTENWNNLQVGNNTLNSTNWDASGNITMAYGGLTVEGLDGGGGVTIATSGLAVTGGVRVAAGGQELNAYDVTFNDGGATVIDGVTVSGGLTIYTNPGCAPVHAVNGCPSVASGGLLVSSGGLKVSNIGVLVTGGVTVSAGGMSINVGAVSVVSGDVSVNSGGLLINTHKRSMTISDGGLLIMSGGLKLDSNSNLTPVPPMGLIVTGGVSISGAIIVSGFLGGVSISSEGLNVPTSGVTIAQTGMDATGGVSILDTGVTITAGGMHAENLGASVSGGAVVDGGVAISALGMEVPAVDVMSSGLIILSGVGLDISDSGMVVYASGSGGKSVNVQAGGLSITGGLLVRGGLTVSSTPPPSPTTHHSRHPPAAQEVGCGPRACSLC